MTRALLLVILIGACKDETNPVPDFPDATRPDAAFDAPIDSPVACYLDAGAAGCFQCAPVQLEDFLNACTDATCVAFDNAARLPLFTGGSLPPLPL